MNRKTITAQFSTGRTVFRRTEHHYTHASRKTPGSIVHFHESADAAYRAAGRDGEVVRTDAPEKESDERVWVATYKDGATREFTVESEVNPFTVAMQARIVAVTKVARKDYS